MKRNKKIRIALAVNGVSQWELARKMGISEFTLCRKLRDELPDDEQEKILSLIETEEKEL